MSTPFATLSDCCPTARRSRRKEARPGELLSAALDLFVDKGYAATRVEEVAARAGVSKGTLFLYFHSKEALFQAVVRDNIAGRFAEWNAELDEFAGSSAELVHYAMRQWWERIGQTQAAGITKIMMSEGPLFPELAAFYQNEVIAPGHALLRRILQRGIDRGEFHIPNLDWAVYSLIAPMIFLVMWRYSMAACCPSERAIDPLPFIETQVNLLLFGMQVRP
jgi:TetR/AcrR family transcriptional regulator